MRNFLLLGRDFLFSVNMTIQPSSTVLTESINDSRVRLSLTLGLLCLEQLWILGMQAGTLHS